MNDNKQKWFENTKLTGEALLFSGLMVVDAKLDKLLQDNKDTIARLEKNVVSLKIVEEFLAEHSHELCDEMIADKKTIADLKAEVNRLEGLARFFERRSFKLHKKIQLSRKPANYVGELFDVGTKDNGGNK